MKVYVVIWHDRHCDDGISVHKTREGADLEIEKAKADYEDYEDHEWTEHDYGRSIGWVRYVASHDEGPRGKIQEVELQP